jgi:hypothetical protein
MEKYMYNEVVTLVKGKDYNLSCIDCNRNRVGKHIVSSNSDIE